MRYKSDHKKKARSFILDTAGRRLRKDGFDGVGVHGLMEELGLTTGAFYSHFSCKEELLLEVLSQGLQDIVKRLDLRVAGNEPLWIKSLFRVYFSKEHCLGVSDGCVLPALTVDASRAGDAAKVLYHDQVLRVVERLTHGLKGKDDPKTRSRAWTALSIMVGAVTIARALPAGETQDELLRSVIESADLIL